MAAKFSHQLLGAFLTSLMLLPFVVGQGSYGSPDGVGPPTSDDTFQSDINDTLVSRGWNSLPLTYGFVSTSSLPVGLDVQVVTSIIDAAFLTWQVAVPELGFQRISLGENANIKIDFIPLDTVYYGYAYFPPDGRLYLDNSHITWSTKSYPAIDELDLMSGALHVIGITLGLGNSDDPSAVMYPILNYGSIKRNLSEDDITRIQALY
ncbi:hypothetical protein HRI_003550600 [Hibiscus trionum]|uniref:Peptidase M10 metallopeptidase domain-containing protein n=1 Tax=Hibiscus trionum TaxID=183268 RepID=A0A9W7IRL5_HIBTR|nr:hypothetical protein HRI_003550600 [Hibiscus trionum]